MLLFSVQGALVPRGFEQPFATATEERRRFSPDEDEMTSEEYKKAFGLSESYAKDPKKALEFALDIRKFEIELYWKRATYFWAFIAIALAGFGSVLAAKGIPCDEKGEALLTASCLGLVFSVAWYFVNRASKLWQENWEKHVDLLEDEVIGPLYKTVMNDDDIRFWRLWGPFPFSVSKLNQILSMFVVLLFLLLVASALWKCICIGWSTGPFAISMVILTIAAIVTLSWKGKTTQPGKVGRVRAIKRVTKIV
jgi:hypothetical protein